MILFNNSYPRVAIHKSKYLTIDSLTLKTMTDNRFKTLYMIHKQCHTTTALSQIFHRSISCISKDLRVLHALGLIMPSKKGRTTPYHITDDGLDMIELLVQTDSHFQALEDNCVRLLKQ